MFEHVTGSIWDQGDIVLVTVNCAGVMGAGIALQCAERYPDMEREYVRACRRKSRPFRVGDLMFMARPEGGYVCMFPTLDHYWNCSYDIVECSLRALVTLLNRDVELGTGPGHECTSIAVPPLGCGVGGLDWSVVLTDVKRVLGALNPKFRVLVFDPQKGR